MSRGKRMTKLHLLCPLVLGGTGSCFTRLCRRGFQTISSSSGAATAKMSTEGYKFGPYEIDPKEVFFSTALSYAMVNLRPVVPAQRVGEGLECYHKASSLTFTIQDGPQAGQTVPHVHIHILPRTYGDFERNDEIYDAIDVKEKEVKEKLDLDKGRKDRSLEEMAKEADEYRLLFLQKS